MEISVITCTKRHYCMDTLFQNYSRQTYKNKELIVILNHKDLKMKDYIKAAKLYKNVRIFNLPEHVPLGSCLNYGVKLAKYNLIAKFDDDDYYAPSYLTDSLRVLSRTKADIVGKRAHYMYLNGKKLLLLRYAKMANKYVPIVQGATLLVKRHVFNRVRFPNRNRGESVKFCSDSRAKGFKIYAGDPYHFIAMRRKNSKDHTWIVSDSHLLANQDKVLKMKNIRQFVERR
ncbi:Glycosyl transferase family 2 [compost metagenome]